MYARRSLRTVSTSNIGENVRSPFTNSPPFDQLRKLRYEGGRGCVGNRHFRGSFGFQTLFRGSEGGNGLLWEASIWLISSSESGWQTDETNCSSCSFVAPCSGKHSENTFFQSMRFMFRSQLRTGFSVPHPRQ